MRSHYDEAVKKRIETATAYAERVQATRPDDHRAIALAWAYVRKVKRAAKEATA